MKNKISTFHLDHVLISILLRFCSISDLLEIVFNFNEKLQGCFGYIYIITYNNTRNVNNNIHKQAKEFLYDSKSLASEVSSATFVNFPTRIEMDI